jgi:hypothetical protein
MPIIKRPGLSALFLILSLSVSAAAETTPTQQAIKDGYEEVKALSDVLKPLVTKSLPAKDYGTLIASGKDVAKATFQYSHMSYDTHLKVKDSTFRACRDSLSLAAQAYAAAAERYDSIAVCKLLPEMDSYFEKSVAAILPIRWPDYEKLYAAAELLYNRTVSSDAPRSKFDTTKVVAEITRAMTVFATSPIPAECTIAPDLVDSERTYYSKVVEKLNAAWTAKDTVQFKKHTTDLKTRLRTFLRIYLQ